MGENQFNSTPSQLLGSLARELKNPLTLIARQAELENLNTKDPAYLSIQHSAERTLKLIDGYLLMAQSEYGQVKLPLVTTGLGSAIFDVVDDLRPYAKSREFILSSDIKDTSVMANPDGLRTALWCLIRLAIDSPRRKDDSVSKEIMVSAKSSGKDDVMISVYGNLDVNSSDIELARKIQGKSHLALSMHNEGSGINLAIADILTSSIGDGLKTTRRGDLSGLSFKLLKSQQLQLV